MSAMQREVYEAFRAIDIPEEKALKAAAALGKRVDDVSSLKGDIVLVKWMLGVNLALVMAVSAKLFLY